MLAPTDMVRTAAVTDGVLIVNKEAGWTSHDVVAKIRSLLGGVKVGHAGTLDPAATGVLPVLVGRATRVAEYLVEWNKEYRAVLRLGDTTDTEDATGTVLTRVDPSGLSDAVVGEVVASFRGPQQQIPPMYSAVKVGGRPLYKVARSGKTVERQPRSIVIHTLDVLNIQGRDVTLNVVCSKGTYIRTLCADIGRALGVGGHLLALERRRVGPLSIGQALSVEAVAHHVAVGTLQDRMLGLDQVLEQVPAVVVTDEQARRVVHGVAMSSEGAAHLRAMSEPVCVRLTDVSGRLLAIGLYDPIAAGPIKIQKVLVEIESLH